jgi:hypothetical protein
MLNSQIPARATIKLLDGLSRGEKAGAGVKRRLKPGTVLVRDYQGERAELGIAARGREAGGGDTDAAAAPVISMTFVGAGDLAGMLAFLTELEDDPLGH